MSLVCRAVSINSASETVSLISTTPHLPFTAIVTHSLNTEAHNIANILKQELKYTMTPLHTTGHNHNHSTQSCNEACSVLYCRFFVWEYYKILYQTLHTWFRMNVSRKLDGININYAHLFASPEFSWLTHKGAVANPINKIASSNRSRLMFPP